MFNTSIVDHACKICSNIVFYFAVTCLGFRKKKRYKDKYVLKYNAGTFKVTGRIIKDYSTLGVHYRDLQARVHEQETIFLKTSFLFSKTSFLFVNECL